MGGNDMQGNKTAGLFGNISRRQLMRGVALSAPLLGLASLGGQIRSAIAATSADTLVVSIGNDIGNLDPDHYASWNDYWFYGNVFQGLFQPNLDGDLEPGLAESYEQSADGLSHTFTLRAGAKWHNGDPVTSDDVIFSYQRSIDPATRNRRASLIGRNVASIEKIDDRRFTVKLNAIDAETIAKFSLYWQVKPKKYIETVGDDAFAAKPVGSGPYKFVERRANQYIKLAKFDDYWGPKSHVAEVTINIVPEEQSRIAQVMAGESDMATPISPVVADRLKDSNDVKVVTVPALVNIVLFLSTLHPETSKLEVRQAICHAIDRKAMLESIMLGYGAPEELWCVESQPSCDLTGVTTYDYDPDKARDLLKKANFDFSKPIKFLGQAPGRVAASKETCEAIVAYLQQVGITANLELLEFGAWNAIKSAEQGKKDPSYAIIYGTAPDPSKDVAYKLAINTGATVRAGYVFDPENEAMLQKMNSFTSMEERYAFQNKIMRQLHDKAYILPLWANDTIYVAAKNVDIRVPSYLAFAPLNNVAKTA
jgi:peptide/nickel transport system substrate-binding protein